MSRIVRRGARPLRPSVATAAVVALAVGCGAALGCGRDKARPEGAGATRSEKPLKERIQGAWSVRPDAASIDKMRANLRRLARGDEAKLAEMVQQFSESTASTTIEFTGDRRITREGGREVRSEPYAIVQESADDLTIQVGGAREELHFHGDDAATATLRDVGGVELKRR